MCKKEGAARTPVILAAADHVGVCSNEEYDLDLNGSVEDIRFLEPARGLGMPRSNSIKQHVMWAGSLLRAFLKS